MSTALAFDTYSYVKKLRDAGVPEQQAEVQVAAIASILHDRMVTKEDHRRDLKELETSLKRDLKELETSLKRDIKELETKLEGEIAGVRRDIKELEMRLLIRLGTLLVVGIGVIATLVKVL